MSEQSTPSVEQLQALVADLIERLTRLDARGGGPGRTHGSDRRPLRILGGASLRTVWSDFC